MRRPRPSIRIERAHDVRQLRVCAKCNAIGDRRFMPVVAHRLLHGGCALDEIGVDGLARLPECEVNKISLGEIGAGAMRKLCDRVAANIRRSA